MRPVTDCANHHASQMPAMTTPNELAYTKVRHPPALAQRGASGGAYSPTFCCSSVSPPMRLAGLDSLEPRWISQTVAEMYNVNCRYSDCQFSITSAQNSAEDT